MVIVLGYTLFLLACSSGQTSTSSPKPQRIVAATPSPPQQASTEDQMLLLASKTLRAQKLLVLPDQCYGYRFDPTLSGSFYTIEVSENHVHAVCGGDPQTQPHLFSVHIDKSTHTFLTDAQSPGIFHPLQP